ncbi:antibiotic biosynthesis monooxygenase [Janibacter melonis]|uniref:antibiotic biosynthesis monooxygenase n=1 Tax=Janibacter melonis TaxID=262209 RepID=UPI001E500913|nr:antibiotic biosynthesis monooxygenase [Janibacter melonis]MCB5990643.1 antibiotic biosynthesis monooxygenase [Janibacter melonis]
MSTPPSHPVTVAITRQVDPQDEILMQAWADAGTTMAQRFPGFLGSGWVRPSAGSHEWHMLYRFDSAESLRRWEGSRERTQWLGAGARLVRATRVEHRTGIEGWFDEPTEIEVGDTVAAPPRWKQMVVIFCAFFPTSVVLTYALAGPTAGWPGWGRVLLTCAVAIPWMTYVFLPFVTRLFSPWTHPRRAG